jgi:hypothetical protein
MMRKLSLVLFLLLLTMAPILALGAGTASAACTGPGAPTNTQTKCLTAVQIPGQPLRSYDISWVNPDRAEYYLADRSNAGIDVIDTRNDTFKRRLGGFVGVVLTGVTPANPQGTVNNNLSGPDGVVSHGRWVYGGDGDSTLKVFDLDAAPASALSRPSAQGGKTRVDEMLTADGLLFAANNAGSALRDTVPGRTVITTAPSPFSRRSSSIRRSFRPALVSRSSSRRGSPRPGVSTRRSP